MSKHEHVYASFKNNVVACVSCGETKENIEQRPVWNNTWMSIAFAIANRSTDERLKVGAIIVASDHTSVLSIGYNGNWAGGPNCHDSKELGKSGFIHAEENALIKCDFNFHKDKYLYITHSPCVQCCKLIINAGIKKVFYSIKYRDTSGLSFFDQVKSPIECTQLTYI